MAAIPHYAYIKRGHASGYALALMASTAGAASFTAGLLARDWIIAILQKYGVFDCNKQFDSVSDVMWAGLVVVAAIAIAAAIVLITVRWGGL